MHIPASLGIFLDNMHDISRAFYSAFSWKQHLLFEGRCLSYVASLP